MWIILALASHFLWAIENIGTKMMVSNKGRSPYVFLVLLTLVGSIAVLFVPEEYRRLPNPHVFLPLLLASIFYLYGGIPYTVALSFEEVTRVNILWNLIPIFSLILGFTIGDTLAPLEYIALFLLVLGAVIASIKTSTRGTFSFSKAFWLMLLSSFCFSLYGVIIRYLTMFLPFPTIFFWVTLLDATLTLLFFLSTSFRHAFGETIRKSNWRLWGGLVVIALIYNSGIFLNQWALSLKATSLVFAFEGFQVLCVFVIAGVVSKKYPNVLEESLDKKNLFLKAAAFGIMIAGGALLTLS